MITQKTCYPINPNRSLEKASSHFLKTDWGKNTIDETNKSYEDAIIDR